MSVIESSLPRGNQNYRRSVRVSSRLVVSDPSRVVPFLRERRASPALPRFDRSHPVRPQPAPRPVRVPDPPLLPAVGNYRKRGPAGLGIGLPFSFLGALPIAFEGLIRNRARSLLAMLGIIIGVGAVIAMMALGEGSKQQVEDQIRQMGTNLLSVRAGQNRQRGVAMGRATAQSLTLEDAWAIREECPSIAMVSPRVTTSAQAEFGNRNSRVDVAGVSRDFFQIRAFPLATGRVFGAAEEQRQERVCVLGSEVAETLFRGREPLGAWIQVRGQPYRVIGTLKPRGGRDDWDDNIFIPIATAMKRLMGIKRIQQIEVTARTKDGMVRAEEEIAALLRRRHHLRRDQEDDFQVRNQLDLLETANETGGVFTALLAGIAGVSLLVGGIGIMNIMLVSVVERTREIGIRRAIGARKADVLAQFLFEALVMCGTGAALGILAGLGACQLAAQAGWPMVLHPGSVWVSCGVAVSIGLFFGFYPAVRAAQLSPIQALRHD